MITRIYIDNFRCFQNFKLDLDRTNIFLGANGSGKSSVFEVLRKIQRLVVRGEKVEEVFSARDLSNRTTSPKQTFEICIGREIDGLVLDYRYELVIEHDREKNRARVLRETLRENRLPLFDFEEGNARLYRDDNSEGPSYPFDWSQSGLGMIQRRHDNRRLSAFKDELRRWIIVNPCPPVLKPEARSEDEYLSPLMDNFVAWYRHVSQENMGGVVELFSELSEAIPAFDSMSLAESGENVRTLKIALKRDDGGVARLNFDQVSDGQRQLIGLYSLLYLSGERGTSLFIDEPDNYLALAEVQPWATAIVDRCGPAEPLEQAVLISHHPVTIDYLAKARGRWFARVPEGPTRVADDAPDDVEGLTYSEIVARGLES